jgi:group I intron endonuclease
MRGIYIIKNIVKNKIYIGCSIHLNKRIAEHKNMLIKNKHENKYLQNSVNKYGIDRFVFDILVDDDSLSIEELWELEEMYIRLFNTTNKKIGYNLCFGGKGTKGRYWSEEEKQERILLAKRLNYADRLNTSEAKEKRRNLNIDRSYMKTKEFRNKMSNSMKGRVFSEEHKINKSLAQMGKNNPIAKKVSIEGKIYECIVDAVNELNVKRNTICYRLNSISERFKNWYYVN